MDLHWISEGIVPNISPEAVVHYALTFLEMDHQVDHLGNKGLHHRVILVKPCQQVFTPDPSAKDFVRSGAAVTGLWKIVHGHMLAYSLQGCYDTIEQYVDGHDGGLTRRCMRHACKLPTEDPDVSGERAGGPNNDPVDASRLQMRRDADKLICYMLDNDMDAISEAQLRTATCLPGKNTEARQSRFKDLVQNGFWKAARNNTKNLVTSKSGAGARAVIPCMVLSRAIGKCLGYLTVAA